MQFPPHFPLVDTKVMEALLAPLTMYTYPEEMRPFYVDEGRHQDFKASITKQQYGNFLIKPYHMLSFTEKEELTTKAFACGYFYGTRPTEDEEDSEELEDEPVEETVADPVPQPRLVGVETNPGPTLLLTDGKNKSKKGKTQQLVSARPATQVLVPTSSRVHISRVPRAVPNASTKFLKEYISTLEDPWETGPVNLGYGTLIDTVLGTAYLRNSITVNADGSFGIMMQPQSPGMVLTNTSGTAGVVWTTVASSNNTALNNQMLSGRVVSGGLRIFCLFPETSSSGVLFAGSLPGYSFSTLTGLSTQSFSQLSTTELGIGKRGARSTMLPIDMTAFNMSPNVLLGAVGTVIAPLTTPYIVGLGFPVGTVVWYESILNIEGVPVSTSSAIGIDSDTPEPRASDYFVTPERLMRAAGGLLRQTVVMDAVQGMLSFASPTAGRALGRARSIFGNGTHYRQALVAGEASRGQSRQQSVVIEEMKDEANLSVVPRSRGWY